MLANENVSRADSTDQLNSFLRGEISAVETYRLALEKVTDPAITNNLRECMSSHQQRVSLLQARVRTLGGMPSTDSGPWGAFAKLITGGATVFGDKAAVGALEEGEDHGLKDYKTDITKLDPESRTLVEQQLLPAQQRSHQTMSTLKKTLEQRMS